MKFVKSFVKHAETVMPSTEFKKTIFGAIRVSYDCPKCCERLTSPLNEAGMQDSCPNCRIQFIVPGANRLRQETDRLAEKKRNADEPKRRQEKKLEADFASSSEPLAGDLDLVVLAETLANDNDSSSVESNQANDLMGEHSKAESNQHGVLIAGLIGIAVAAMLFVSMFLRADALDSDRSLDFTLGIPRLTGTVTRDDVRRTLRDMEDRVPGTLRDMEGNLPDVMADMETEMMKNASEYGLSTSDVRDQMRSIEASAREQIRGMESDVRQNIRDMEGDVMRQLRSSGF